MNTVAYVLRLCCGGAEAAGYQRWEKQLHPIRDAGSARQSAWRGELTHSQPTRRCRGPRRSCSWAVPPSACASPFPLGPLRAGDSGSAPVLHPEQGGRLAGAGSQTAQSQGGCLPKQRGRGRHLPEQFPLGEEGNAVLCQ